MALGGPALLVYLYAEVPWFGALLDALSLIAQVIALMPGKGGSVARAPPREQMGGAEL